jgi:biotin operon repressor
VTIADRILAAIRPRPLDDDVLAKKLGVSQRQSINQVARRLESEGRLHRYVGPEGKIVNAILDGDTVPSAPKPTRLAAPNVAEDDVKRAVSDHLQDQGFDVVVAWGRERGIDIDARHQDGRRYIIEAKGGVSLQPQQVNYFVGALGELVQRMSDPHAAYGLALPDNRQYRGLVDRLPKLSRERLHLVVFWVKMDKDGLPQVEVDD